MRCRAARRDARRGESPGFAGREGAGKPLWINQHCGGSGQMIEGSTNVIVGG
jgi:hypothetical protein